MGIALGPMNVIVPSRIYTCFAYDQTYKHYTSRRRQRPYEVGEMNAGGKVCKDHMGAN